MKFKTRMKLIKAFDAFKAVVSMCVIILFLVGCFHVIKITLGG